MKPQAKSTARSRKTASRPPDNRFPAPARRYYRASVLLVPFAFSLILGCADTKDPSARSRSINDRQDDALNDPFSYGPKTTGDTVGSDMPTVTGDGEGFDRKGFKRDLDRVLGR